MQHSLKLIQHVKIRVGEPLTCVASSEKGIAFGSISGYIGYYSFANKEVYYIKEVFEEIIRQIEFISSEVAYVCVGDESGLVVDFRNPESIQFTNIQYTKHHNLSQCANTIPFLFRDKCLLVPFPSTNAKENQIDSYFKQSAWLINFESRDQHELGKIPIATYSVPFCFDGKKLLWLEYRENKDKTLMYYDIQKQSVDQFHTFSHKGDHHFISHVKWFGEQLVLVKNNKIVEIFDPQTHKITSLYQHNSQIVALAIFIANQTPQKDTFEIEIKNEEEKLSDQDSRRTETNLIVVTVDHSEQMYIYKDNKLSKIIELRKIPNFPPLPKNSYLFDMGYPYFLSVDSKRISVTSDSGLFIFEHA